MTCKLTLKETRSQISSQTRSSAAASGPRRAHSQFKQIICELLASTAEKELSVEQFVSLRSRLIGLLDQYNAELYKGTSLEIQPAPAERQTRPPSDTPSANLPRKRGRPPLVHNRECHHCHTRSTSEWRTGETPNTFLCNACGLKVLKKRKREQQLISSINPTYPVNAPAYPPVQ